VTTEDLSGGSKPRRAPSGAVPAPPTVRDVDIASVRDVSFPIALRGYERDAVDAYVRDVNRIIAELQVGRSPQSAIRHALDQVSDETRGILERAHETADEITARSRSQADDRLQWAEREAREAIASAAQRVHDLEGDAERVWQERQSLVEDVHRIAADLTAVADDAAVRFPAEPDLETAPLPDLPPLPPKAGGPPVETRSKPVEEVPPQPPKAGDPPPIDDPAPIDDPPPLPSEAAEDSPPPPPADDA
jgi:DivIVA domain-containing protein